MGTRMYKSYELKGKERCKRRRERQILLESGKKAENVYEKAALIKTVIKECLKSKHYDEKAVFSQLEKQFEKMDYPTEKTREAHLNDAMNQVRRYVLSELDLIKKGSRKVYTYVPGKIMDMDGICEVDVKPDLICRGVKDFKRKTIDAKGKEKTILVPEPYLEVVKIRCSLPDVTQSGKQKDTGVNQNIELYSMLKYARTLLDPKKDHGINVGASYYFLRKKGDDKKYVYDFFDTKGGGNIVTLWEENFGLCPQITDDIFLPQLREYIEGDEVCNKETCKSCEFNCTCNFTRPPKYIEEVEIKKSISDLDLTEQQEEAIGFRKGIARINAGAGSGKTLVTALRIAYMLEEGVKPEEICMLTFTNTGAEEMRERVRLYTEDLGCDADVSKLVSTTFNSFGNTIVKENYKMFGFTEPPELIDDIERLSIIAKLLRENYVEGLDYKNFLMNFPYVKGALHTANKAFEIIKDKRLSIGDNEILEEELRQSGYGIAYDPKSTAVENLLELYAEFNEILKKENLIEYSDQELMILELLKKNPFYFEDYGFKHVVVDEFQDTNERQFEILKYLIDTPDFESFMVVGDDSQSIFAFRGSTPEFIINFFENLGEDDGQDFYLLENHRSTPEIIDFANTINALNSKRVIKDLIATRPHGEPVVVKQFWKKEDETNFIIEEIKKRVAEGTKYEDIAYIASKRDELLKMGAACTENGIPYIMLNPEPVLQNSRVSAAIALARFFKDTSASKDAFEYLNAKYDNDLLNAKTDEEIKKEMLLLEGMVKVIRKINDLEAFKNLINDLDDDDEIFSGFRDSVFARKSLDSMLDYCTAYDCYGEKEAVKRQKKYPGVVLTTAHSSKGMEWPICFNTITNYAQKGLSRDAVEEKRRLLFVSATRARDVLYITGQAVAFGDKKNRTYNQFLKESMEAIGHTFSTVDPYDKPKVKVKSSGKARKIC